VRNGAEAGRPTPETGGAPAHLLRRCRPTSVACLYTSTDTFGQSFFSLPPDTADAFYQCLELGKRLVLTIGVVSPTAVWLVCWKWICVSPHTFWNIAWSSVWPIIVLASAINFRNTCASDHLSKNVLMPSTTALQSIHTYKCFLTNRDVTIQCWLFIVCVWILFSQICLSGLWSSTNGTVTFYLTKQICKLSIKVS